MNKICVYTCITGNYDNLIEVEKREEGIDYICYTNNKKLKSKTWNIKYIEDSSLNNVKLARKIKILGTEELKKYEITLWMDGQIQFTSSIKNFISKHVDLKKYNIVGFKHYCRNSVNEEIDACFQYKKEEVDNLIKVRDYLEKEKFPDNLGLIESTLLFRNFNDTNVNKCMEQWFCMIKEFSHRDQLSFQYAQWKTKTVVNLLPINIWNNNYFKHLGHNYCDTIKYKIANYTNNRLNLDEISENEIKINNNKLELEFCIKSKSEKVMIFFECTSDFAIKKINYEEDTNIEKYYYMNCASYNEKIVFNNNPILVIEGDFTKKQKIRIILELEIGSGKDMYIDLINKQSASFFEAVNIIKYNENLISELKLELDGIKQEKMHLKKDLNCQNEKYKELEYKYLSVINSKGWKVLDKLRRIIKKFMV